MQHVVEQHPEGKHVHLGVLVLALDDFGGDVVGSAADGRPRAAHPEMRAEAEVAQLGLPLIIQQHVLRFDVAVDDGVAVQVVESRQQLGQESGDLLLPSGLVLQGFEEVSSGAVLENDVQDFSLDEVSEEFDDVGVVQVFVDLDFATDCVFDFICQLLQPDDFHGIFLLGGEMNAEFDIGQQPGP